MSLTFGVWNILLFWPEFHGETFLVWLFLARGGRRSMGGRCPGRLLVWLRPLGVYIYLYLLYIYTLAFNYSKISVRIGKRKMSSSFTPDRGVWAVCRVAWVSTSVISWSCGRHFPATLGVAALCCRFDGKFPSFKPDETPHDPQEVNGLTVKSASHEVDIQKSLSFFGKLGKVLKDLHFFFFGTSIVFSLFQIADLAIKLFVCGSSGQPHAA